MRCSVMETSPMRARSLSRATVTSYTPAVFLLRRVGRDDGERHGDVPAAGLILLQRIAQDEQVPHVVAVQMRKEHHVDLECGHKFKQAGKRAAAKVEQQPAPPAFEQVA